MTVSVAAPINFLLLSERPQPSVKETQILRLTEHDKPDVVLPMKHLRNVQVLEFDPANNQIYWIDGKSKTVKRSYIDGAEVGVRRGRCQACHIH